MSNTFGRIFRMTTFGESHGPSIGVVIDGCPAGVPISREEIQKELDRRKPGQSELTSSRKEADEVSIESGVYDGKSTGSPIVLRILNKDAKPGDYSDISRAYRPSHADYTYSKKYGLRDPRGGGRSSARETACRVAAGAIALVILEQFEIEVHAFVDRVGSIALQKSDPGSFSYEDIDKSAVRCPDPKISSEMERAIMEARREGDTLGGSIACHVLGLPVGLGEPIYDKFHARLAAAMIGINAAKGIEFGSGFGGTRMRGSEHNDAFAVREGEITTTTNHSGGIQGGITNGMPVDFRVGFKPVSTIMQSQSSVSNKGEEVMLEGKGRHDPCVLPRAVPIVKAMAAIVTADFVLLRKTNRL